MQTVAVVLHRPEQLSLSAVQLLPAAKGDIVVDIEWSGISTGTEKLLWNGHMPNFPGMGYPLVPGYESLGRVISAGPESGHRVGERVFVPGARCFKDVRGLFGGAAERLIVPGIRAHAIDENLGEQGVLMALAATAQHALAGGRPAELIVGHGVLGRLLARLSVAAGVRPVVWETQADRRFDARDYDVIDPAADTRKDYNSIYDVSGDATLLDHLISRIAPGGEITLAGFYSAPLSFSFPPAFMREAKIRVAAEWREPDLHTVKHLAASGALALDGLITHRKAAADAVDAYQTAFTDSSCLKIILDWRQNA